MRRASEFYDYLNKEWYDRTTLPDTESRITQSYFSQKRINKELDAIIDADKGAMRDFMQSWVAAEEVPHGITPVLHLMQSMRTQADISSRIGWMNRYGFPTVLAIYVQGDPRDHRRCRIFIEEGQPRIGIPEYWRYPEYLPHRKAYAVYVRRLAHTMGIPELLHGYGAEREFAHVFPTVLERKENLTMLTWRELCKEYAVIDWRAMFSAWGLETLEELEFIVTSAAFLHHIQARIERWSIQRWQAWFALQVVQTYAGCSPHGPLRSAWFDYARRFLQGAIRDETPTQLRHSVIYEMMPNTLGKLWIQKHKDMKVHADATRMIAMIKRAAAAQLGTTSWMSPATRQMAVRKLRMMKVEVGWPDLKKWVANEIACDLTDNLVGNMMLLAKVSVDENQKMLKCGDCRRPTGDNWARPVYEVNAYYYPDENRFLLPYSILQPPYYNSGASLAANYGSTGATIGHEFCHAFDSDGRAYDEHGDKRMWWSKHDDAEYRKKANQVERLYESVQYRGMDVDGGLTLVENIADLGGMEFALGGLRLALGRPPTKAELREFFESYTISWRSKDRLKRAAQLLDTDTHSPPMLRVNHVVRQMDEWYEAYDIDSSYPGWIAPEKRIHFFA